MRKVLSCYATEDAFTLIRNRPVVSATVNAGTSMKNPGSASHRADTGSTHLALVEALAFE